MVGSELSGPSAETHGEPEVMEMHCYYRVLH